jgi:hypothetical protein
MCGEKFHRLANGVHRPIDIGIGRAAKFYHCLFDVTSRSSKGFRFQAESGQLLHVQDVVTLGFAEPA